MKRLFLVGLLCITSVAHADEPPLWKVIIGEAVSEGYEGLYAVCCVAKNRLNKGMSLGLVAANRKDLDRFVQKQGVKYERMAKEIVQLVFKERNYDSTEGATHFENLEEFPVPEWASKLKVVKKIKRHTFYR